jgi:alkylmercury lyase
MKAQRMTNYALDENAVDNIVDLLLQAFPQMSEQEQILALSLYRLLAGGAAVSSEQLANNCNQPVNVVENCLANWPGIFFDNNNNVVGFWGLTINDTPHQLEVNNKTVFTWCAFDTLFIPQLLNETVQVTSTCPVNNEKIHLTVTPEKIIFTDKNEIVVSFLMPDEKELLENITTSFCHYVYFFNHLSDGEQWCKEHPDTFLLPLEDAFEVGKRFNASRYALALA